ncbi:MAG: type II toxin-antitoxin system RelE/ParE family toxin [Terracidiphilus sp.]|jgi:phage-related protein
MRPLHDNPSSSRLPKSTTRGTVDKDQLKRIPAIFYRTEAGNEPVRSWLRTMDPQDRRLVGEDIKTVEFGWPVGMPTCRPMGGGLYEVRTPLPGNRGVRIFFYVDRMQRMVLLHGIVKKTRETPDADLDLARRNMRKHEKGLR